MFAFDFDLAIDAAMDAAPRASTSTSASRSLIRRGAAIVDDKKQRRNARDRSRSQLRKTIMETMRLQVAQLEATKQQLEQRIPSRRRYAETVPSPSTTLTTTTTTSTTDGDDSDDDSDEHDAAPRLQAQYLHVLQQLERLRQTNRAMALDVAQRDLFRSAVQNLVDARAKTVTPLVVENDDVSRPHDPLREYLLPPPMPARDAADFARRVTQQIHTARRESENRLQHGANAPRVFGWSDVCLLTDATIQFTIHKTFAHSSAQELTQYTWDILRDSTRLRVLLPSGVQCELREVQRVGDDAIVFDRITTDRKFHNLAFSALRTTYMLVRAIDAHGRCCIGMKTIDLPAFRQVLAVDEAWCDIFYWFYFEDVVVETDTATVVAFGGALSYFSESVARTWLAELVFLAVRWESRVIGPVFLQN